MARERTGRAGDVLFVVGGVVFVVVMVVMVVDLVRSASDFVTGEGTRDSARETARRIGEVWATGELNNSTAVPVVSCEQGSGEPGLALNYPMVDGQRAHDLLGADLRRRGWHEQQMPYGYRYQKTFDDWSAIVALTVPPIRAPLDVYVTAGGDLGDDCSVFRHEVEKALRARPRA